MEALRALAAATTSYGTVRATRHRKKQGCSPAGSAQFGKGSTGIGTKQGRHSLPAAPAPPWLTKTRVTLRLLPSLQWTSTALSWDRQSCTPPGHSNQCAEMRTPFLAGVEVEPPGFSLQA